MPQDTVPLAPPSDRQGLDLGNWLGRGQAFSLIASKCAAAQAQCLKTIRQQGAYKSLGLTWEDFCQQHLGLSRSHADQLIRRLDQFGAAYFRLAEIMRISPDSFRRIAPAVHDDCIEIAGELVPITPENALKIKQAVLAWQKDSQRARAEPAKAQAANASIISLKSLLDACLAEMSAIIAGLLSYTLNKLKRLQRDLHRILAWRPGGFLWGGRPRPQPDPLVGLGLVPNPSRTKPSGALQGDRPISVNLSPVDGRKVRNAAAMGCSRQKPPVREHNRTP